MNCCVVLLWCTHCAHHCLGRPQGDDSLPMIFLSQAVMGLGTSTLGVCRGFVADKSPTKERTQRLAQLTALQVRYHK
jgi:hypothetical protein